MKVLFKLLNGFLPKKQTIGSAGYDLFSAVDLIIESNSLGLVKLGFEMEIESGFEAQIRSRSGLALKHQVFVLNSPGTIDSDYRNEVGVILMNLSSVPFVVNFGDRIAQMIFSKICDPQISLISDLSSSSRHGGFGSTGIS